MLDRRSKDLRRAMVDMLWHGRRGHLASALSLTEIVRVLYDEVLRFDPARPRWEERDRFILSKGHGCIALYVMLADKGFFPAAELKRFCAKDGILGGHPDQGLVPGVEASTGALGHGLPIAVGMALDARRRGRGHRVLVAIGDGEAAEGSNWEAMQIAAKHGLDNLVVVVDCNHQQSWSTTATVTGAESPAAKWTAFGAAVRAVDGHDTAALRAAFAALPFAAGRPSVVICHTVKGKGIAGVEGDLSWHHKTALTEEEYRSLLARVEAYDA
jgi:transketolase